MRFGTHVAKAHSEGTVSHIFYLGFTWKTSHANSFDT